MRNLLVKYRSIYKKTYPIFIIISAAIAILSDKLLEPSSMLLFYLPLILSSVSFVFLFMYAFNKVFPNARYFIRITRIPRKNSCIGSDREESKEKRVSKAMDAFLNVSLLLIPLSLILFVVCLLCN